MLEIRGGPATQSNPGLAPISHWLSLFLALVYPKENTVTQYHPEKYTELSQRDQDVKLETPGPRPLQGAEQ